MKKHILTILLLVSVGIVFGLYATSDLPNIIEKVSVAMSKGESAEIAKYLNPTVEVEILGQDNIYSKAQTELMLKDFFAKNKPKSFKVNHQGTKGATGFAIGILISETASFRVSLFFKAEKETYKVHQLRIENGE
ncbi:MAG TPA: DUF4783 domain-containing protein [Tenuifilaceae bacterium]|jgi:hypothetical protein|nr:DUF4783 domain-containing protein [Bacteroidales bacterium]MDI9516893.1 DUF4783 domain-containing protein [Bacteroidota bacterium]NLH56392.1 DUF4783 domain-containing protein [Rikenellaceae bacterium]OQC63176.1 MAG: hypothetical protein BWX49_01386 [Bacteroidetes bacterium ADurb.Bin008]HNV81204.1 DUF4783 domain-containing protein [Tenuifilaceae bacterium]